MDGFDMVELDRLRPGDHVCWLFDDDDGRLDAMTRYVAAGLRAADKVLCFADTDITSAALAALRRSGTDPDPAVQRRQLAVATAQESYLASGAFEPEAMMRAWTSAAAQAKGEGYRCLRVVADMSWAAWPVPGVERLAWYEAQVNRVFAGAEAMAVCLYDTRLFDDLHRSAVCWAHPGTCAPATPQPEPLLRMIRTDEPPGLRLVGEADLSNRRALQAVVEHLFDDSGAGSSLTIDVSGLRFADAASTMLFVRLAALNAGRVHVTGCSPSVRRLLAFNGADVLPSLTIAGDPE